jgi:hypothetical protein
MAKRGTKRGRKPIFTEEQRCALPGMIAAQLKKEIKRLQRKLK